MAINDREKLNRFAAEVLAEAHETARAILWERDAKEREELEKRRMSIRAQVLAENNKKLEKKVAENGRALSLAETELQRALLTRREAVLAEVLAAVRDRVLDYTRTEAYRQALCQMCVRILEKQASSFTIYLKTEDMRFSLDILRELSSRPGPASRLLGVEPDESITLGGARFVSAEQNMALDQTLDSAVEAQVGRLVGLVGQDYAEYERKQAERAGLTTSADPGKEENGADAQNPAGAGKKEAATEKRAGFPLQKEARS